MHSQNFQTISPPPQQLAPIQPENDFVETSDPFASGSLSAENYFSDPQLDCWSDEVLNSTTIERFRKSWYQKTTLWGGWIDSGGMQDIGTGYFGASITLAAGNEDNLLIGIPTYKVDYLNGPSTIDVPSRLHSIDFPLFFRKKWNSTWGTMIGIFPSVSSDFQTSATSGFRFGGFAAMTWEVLPEQLTLFGGVVYLDRNDVDLIPAAGLTWTPTSDIRFDLMFPKPKIAKRIGHHPFVSEDWIYLAATTGGGTYDVVRANLMRDELTLRDIRLSVGVERMRQGGAGMYAELIWVFGRKLEYLNPPTVLRFDDQIGIEAGFSF